MNKCQIIRLYDNFPCIIVVIYCSKGLANAETQVTIQKSGPMDLECMQGPSDRHVGL